MANRGRSTTTKTSDETDANLSNEELSTGANLLKEELSLDTKVTLKSIADWNTGFSRKADGTGDITISPKGSVRLSRNEVIAQVQMGNKLIAGIDGKGSHATLYIEDAPTRVELGFESPSGDIKQDVFSDDRVESLFRIKDQNQFEEKLAAAIVTRAEKFAVIDAIRRLKINDYRKIRFTERFTGLEV